MKTYDTYCMVATFLGLKKSGSDIVKSMEKGFLFFLPGFSGKVVVSNGLCLVRCVEMTDGHCGSTCQG